MRRWAALTFWNWKTAILPSSARTSRKRPPDSCRPRSVVARTSESSGFRAAHLCSPKPTSLTKSSRLPVIYWRDGTMGVDCAKLVQCLERRRHDRRSVVYRRVPAFRSQRASCLEFDRTYGRSPRHLEPHLPKHRSLPDFGRVGGHQIDAARPWRGNVCERDDSASLLRVSNDAKRAHDQTGEDLCGCAGIVLVAYSKGRLGEAETLSGWRFRAICRKLSAGVACDLRMQYEATVRLGWTLSSRRTSTGTVPPKLITADRFFFQASSLHQTKLA